MKKVISSPLPSSTVLVTDVDKRKYYGFVGLNKRRGFVTQERCDDGNFRILCSHNVTFGNRFAFHDTTLQGLIQQCLAVGTEVYEFDTFEELAVFLIDGNNKD